MKNQEYWLREWERRRGEDNAIVDVDVRGWIYTPHKGQATRKQRLLIGLARQLSGIPAPPAPKGTDTPYSSAAPSRSSSPNRARQEEELIALEADHIIRRGEQEERFARRGAFSEEPRRRSDVDSLAGSRDASPERERQESDGNRLSRLSTASSDNEGSGTITPLQKRTSWAHPSRMGAAELAVANGHLLSRLKPFMANPLANTPIKAFFYNSTASKEHTVFTNPSGHFACRAALDFVPTHVRVLAGEKLSVTEEVHITSPSGVSLISDIDDTIKHTAISAGAREIFRNAFIRDLGDLTIEGVREWYATLYDMGVKIHYVSNSPWQMYPVLTSFFKMARLPRGSFHLKQYTGMLQGIFEPVAERKKSSLDKIMHDFPARKFILVGDSGEADLEVYTEVAQANPGRILGIFIRDVTTPIQTGYFDSSVGSFGGGGGGRHSRNSSRHRNGDGLTMTKRFSRPDDIRNDDVDLKQAIVASLADMEEETHRAQKATNPDAADVESQDGTEDSGRKPEPPRRPRPVRRVSPEAAMTASPEEDLIDFTDEKPSSKLWLEPPSRQATPRAGSDVNGTRKSPASPSAPPKPEALRSPSPNAQAEQSPDRAPRPPPPRPRKPSSAVKPPSPQPPPRDTDSTPVPPRPATAIHRPPSPQPQQSRLQTHQPSPLSQVTRQDSPTSVKKKPPLPERPKTLRAFTGEKLSTAYHSFSYPRGYRHADGAAERPRPPTAASYTDSSHSFSSASAASLDGSTKTETRTTTGVAPPPPPRRNVSSFPVPTAKKSLNRLSGGWDDDSMPPSPGDNLSKKEYLWRTRWTAAQQKLDRIGVTLRSWRVGSDVADVCVRLAEMELRKIDREKPD